MVFLDHQSKRWKRKTADNSSRLPYRFIDWNTPQYCTNNLKSLSMFRLRARDRSSFGSSERPEEPPTSWTTGVGRSTSIQAWNRAQQMRIPLRNVQAWMQKREPYSPWPNHEQDDRIIEENGDVHDFSDDRKELFTGPGESKSSTAQTALAYKQSTELVIDLNHETLRRQLRYNVDGQKDDKS